VVAEPVLGAADFGTEADDGASGTKTGVAWALTEGEVSGLDPAEPASMSSCGGEARVTLYADDGGVYQRVLDLRATSR
jgi:hypothetical protein